MASPLKGYAQQYPPGYSGSDLELLLVAIHWALCASRDAHSALCERIGDYGECHAAEIAAWSDIWLAITDTPLSPDQLGYLIGYPVPKAKGDSE